MAAIIPQDTLRTLRNPGHQDLFRDGHVAQLSQLIFSPIFFLWELLEEMFLSPLKSQMKYTWRLQAFSFTTWTKYLATGKKKKKTGQHSSQSRLRHRDRECVETDCKNKVDFMIRTGSGSSHSWRMGSAHKVCSHRNQSICLTFKLDFCYMGLESGEPDKYNSDWTKD